jgi:tetratricopeptide (TPR) repeat protein
VAKILLIAGMALCAAGVLGITWQFLRRPRRRRLREALAFYRRGVQLLDQGDVTGAVAMGREAVETWTGAGPTIAAPRLVAVLARLAMELGAGLHGAGRDEDAVIHLVAAEAALRDRVDAAPARYRPALAELLTVRAAVEGRLGNYAEALRYDGQALPMLRKLAESDDPEGYALPLARALAIEARHFYEIGRLSEALAIVHQAIERLRAVPERDREESAADLAHATADRAAILLAAGRPEEALLASQEAVGVRLGAHDPDRLRACLALASLGESLLRLGRAAQAIVPLRDAVGLARTAVETDPDRGRPWLASCLSTLAAALAVDAQGIADSVPDTVDKDIAEEALASALEAERIARTLAEASPLHDGLLARAACDLARAYAAVGRVDEARPYADESVRLYEKVSEGRGRRFAAELQLALAVRNHLAS